MSRAEKISAILADEDFQAVVADARDQFTRKVMARHTSAEDRADALAQAHALESLMGHLSAAAHKQKDEKA